MSLLHRGFDWAAVRYAEWFAEWLHMHFVVRTAILLLVLWGALFALAQFFQYVVGPVLLLIYRHVFFRAYNYLIVESLHEWLYIRYYSQDKPRFRALYLRLSDKVKKNRLILTHTRYKGIVYRGGVRRVTWTVAATVGVAATMWLAAFGLHQEYYVPVLAGYESGRVPENGAPPVNGVENDNENGVEIIGDGNENGLAENENEAVIVEPPSAAIYPPGYFDPASLSAYAALRLNAYGAEGARLRDRPGFEDGVVLLMLWGAQEVIFLDAYTPDAAVPGLYWLRVRTEDGLTGYIASHLIEAN